MGIRSAVFAAALASAIAGLSHAAGADPARGRVLYEAHCGACHAASVHGREKREARDFESVRGWVRRWSVNLGLAWTDAEVDDVAVHLNATYYRFPCPATVCRAVSWKPPALRRTRDVRIR